MSPELAANSLDQPAADSAAANPGGETRREFGLSERAEGDVYALVRSVTLFPLLGDGRLDAAARMDGFTWEVGADEICLQLDIEDEILPQDLLMGLESTAGVLEYAGVRVTASEKDDASGRRVRAAFGGRAAKLLADDHLLPRLDPASFQYVLPLPDKVYDNWCDAGVLTPVLLDRVSLCPYCGGLPTYRPACAACGSARVSCEQLIHHFACAHIDLVEAFDEQGKLTCPKCRARRLVVGADYEYLNGPFQCEDCGWRDTQLCQTGHCLACDRRFAMEEAQLYDLLGFHADRLEPASLLPTSWATREGGYAG